MDFKSLVYTHCSKIPQGKVVSYKTLAEKIGHPRAYRAVANALAKNPDAPRVPCHRVVGGDRKLRGYMGESDTRRKRELLEEEGVLFDGDRVRKECVLSEY